MTSSPVARVRREMGRERGAVSAEYAAVTAAGCGFAGVLIKFLTSEAGRALIETILGFFLKMIGI